MTNAVQAYAYAYAGPSTLAAGRLALSTSGGRTARGTLNHPRFFSGLLTERSGLDATRVRAALTQLGAAGRVGYDTAEAGYFHRELPYDRDRVAAMNPRARAARELADGGAVRLDGPGRALVTSGDQVREVRDTACTCPWWARHQGRRGPCKHVLAVQIMKGTQT
ncbi:SWIM zinc finger family protein [Streptosporangium sp. G11]|uniref:SWIM zinc finger family protein n=1 Tax=Streptosporangium sp. G11 TaxID=3436926 RepID=UPI003EC09EAA